MSVERFEVLLPGEKSQRAIEILGKAGILMFDRESSISILDMQIHTDNGITANDVHGFYEVYKSNDSIYVTRPIVHVQAYPGLSDEEELTVYGRIMDKRKLHEIRQFGNVAIGNEHDAAEYTLYHGRTQEQIDWNPEALVGYIEDGLISRTLGSAKKNST